MVEVQQAAKAFFFYDFAGTAARLHRERDRVIQPLMRTFRKISVSP